MTRDLSRLLQPKSIAVIGGGAWCAAIIDQCNKMGFAGEIWRVHPKGGDGVFPHIEDLPHAPDAAFIGINRFATIEAVAVLSKIGTGGAVCFASGFSEAASEDASGAELQAELLQAAGDMPILGPNCYGFINALDGALLWPDQHGAERVAKGVAILTQSSNISINLTMQSRALPIAYMVTCGNMAQTSQAQIAAALLDDPRVTAIGVHIEGFGDLSHWEDLAEKARARGVRIVAIKVGRSDQAQAATISHTASLAGGDTGAQAVLDRLGIARLDSLPAFLETLKLLHVTGGLVSNRIASISCSGGEASLAADTAHGRNVVFPSLNDRQRRDLAAALGPMVALANPLDYHTYIWRDQEVMTQAWSGIVDPQIALTLVILDIPRGDRCDPSEWDIALDAAVAVHEQTGGQVAVVATLPELLPEAVADRLMASGVVPLNGLEDAMQAVEAAALDVPALQAPLLVAAGTEREGVVLSEAEAKMRLAKHGVVIPKSARGSDPNSLAETVGFPLVLKGEGIAHKTEAGAIALGLETVNAVSIAAQNMPCDNFLAEEMIEGVAAELLVGVTRDPAHGFVLTLAAGGVMTELLEDSQSLLIPAKREDIKRSLARLKWAKLIAGFRGKPAANNEAILDAVMAVQDYVVANVDRTLEVEINPLLCTPDRAVAADALIKEVPADGAV
ncbi:acetate--CoA ligase family protein [Aliiroseovarius sp. KMU-50]|uniref:Acetate--CoA ligase family protein n=1 Tax=Aliiroseovarius salicola TaxID=3009082 RepID=A0ABT4W3E8_9RHOB|nr:acetate--CoA ligase family protein [Aliiroseovarius sp. KMU-50]MDA5095052.1 acetate--CoA ligase family protein [Aliiroseovarius sp. KMU-50]